MALVRYPVSLGHFGDSQSSLLHRGEGFSCPITTVSFETILCRLSCQPPTFMKIDIEGSEFAVMPAMRPWLERYHPTLLLSVHAPFLPAETRELSMAGLRDALADLYPAFDIPTMISPRTS